MNARKLLLFLIYGIILIPALPPVFVPLFEPFTFGKTELFEMLVEIMALTWIVGFWHERKSIFSAFAKPVIAKALFFLIGVFSISTLASADIWASFWGSSARNDGLFTLAHFFLFFVVLANTLVKQDWLKLFRFSLFASAFVSFYALLQYFGFPFVRASDGAIFGTIGNSAYLAMYLSFHIFLAIFIAHREPSVKKIPLWQALARYINFDTCGFGRAGQSCITGLAVFESVILFMTHNRAGILGLIFGLMLFAGSVLFMKIRSTTIKNYFVATSITAMIVIFAFYILANADYIRADQTSQSRLIAWNAALVGIAERPFIGHGANQFEQVYRAYVKQAAIATPTQESFDKPHNIILEILFSYGALGLAAYFALWFALFKTVRKIYTGPEQFVWYGMFVAYGVSLLFLFDTFSSLLLFFLFLAFFISHEYPTEHIPKNISFLQSGAVLLCFVFLFSVFHFKPLYSAYWARAFLVNTQATGAADSSMKTEALRYDSFNSGFIRNAILFTEQNLKK